MSRKKNKAGDVELILKTQDEDILSCSETEEDLECDEEMSVDPCYTYEGKCWLLLCILMGQL